METKVEPREYVNIYNWIYKELDDEKKTLLSKEDIEAIDKVVNSLAFNEQIAVKSYFRYSMSYHRASSMSGVPTKKISKALEQGIRHLRSPRNIATVIPTYYFKDFDGNTWHKLTMEDFDGKKYILTALNKSGIYYKEELIKHLTPGWLYLWTIPGCGDGARQQILTTLDKWGISISKLQ